MILYIVLPCYLNLLPNSLSHLLFTVPPYVGVGRESCWYDLLFTDKMDFWERSNSYGSTVWKSHFGMKLIHTLTHFPAFCNVPCSFKWDLNHKVCNGMRTLRTDNHKDILANWQMKKKKFGLDDGVLEGFRPGCSSVIQGGHMEKRNSSLC